MTGAQFPNNEMEFKCIFNYVTYKYLKVGTLDKEGNKDIITLWGKPK